MAKIYIGSEYGKTFDSVVKLYRENCIKEGSVLSADADRIVTPSHEFILARGAAARDDGSFNAVMGDNGASWFGMFRGESVKNDTAEWLMFVESVKEHFHRNYSIVEYLCPLLDLCILLLKIMFSTLNVCPIFPCILF